MIKILIASFRNYHMENCVIKGYGKLPCWLFVVLFDTGLLAAKTAAAAAEAGTVGNGMDVDGIEPIRESIWVGWMTYWAWWSTSFEFLIVCNLFSYPRLPEFKI